MAARQGSPAPQDPTALIEAIGVPSREAYATIRGASHERPGETWEPRLDLASLSIGPRRPSSVVVLLVDDDPGVEGWQAIRASRDLGVRVTIPAFVRREGRGRLARRLAKDRRHILHRLAYPVGHSMIGLEAGAIAGLLEGIRERNRLLPIAVAGTGDAGRAAIAAMAVLTAWGTWSPDQLVVAAPDELAMPLDGGPIDRLVHDQSRVGTAADWMELTQVATTCLGSSATVADLLESALQLPSMPSRASTTPARPVHPAAAFERASDRTFRSWHAWLRHRIEGAPERRARRWALGTAGHSAHEAAARRIRDALALSVCGPSGVPGAVGPVAAASRLIRVTAGFVAYDVELTLEDGLAVWGHLLIPRDVSEPRPVVICQHGLDGVPGDVTGIGALRNDREERDAREVSPYHAYAARLADRGYVVFAPYLTVPEPRALLVNALVVRAAFFGEQRSAMELRKLRALITWLADQPFVDRQRVGYYGLSYGGHAALWLAPLEPRIRVAIVAGHINDWTAKLTDEADPKSFLAHPDEDFNVWRGIEDSTHLELIAAAWPRPTGVEASAGDPITNDGWLDTIETDLRGWAAAWEAGDRFLFDRFEGGHEICGSSTFEFLDRWLRPDADLIRDYEYELWPGRPLPGIGDAASDNEPYIAAPVRAGESIEIEWRPGEHTHDFHGLAFRLSNGSGPGGLERVDVEYRVGPASLGASTIDGRSVHGLWDLWHEAPVPPAPLPQSAQVVARVLPVGQAGAALMVYGPRSLASSDRRLRPAVRPVKPAQQAAEATHEFARELLDGVRSELMWKPATPPTLRWAFATLPSGQVAANAARWLGDALEPVALQVRVGQPRDLTVRLELDEDLAGGPRSHRLTMMPAEVVLAAKADLGWLAGASHVHERVTTARAMPIGQWLRIERVPDRLTTGVLPAGVRYAEASSPSGYSDAVLDRVARAGFTGIWTWLNLEEATDHSTIFPELDDPDADSRVAALNDLTRRAAAFGLDIWVYLASGYRRQVPDSFWISHPELRGGDGWLGPTLCTSQPAVREWHREVVGRIAEGAPELAGLVVIFDIEGFYFCGSEAAAREACPRCRHRSHDELAVEALENLAASLQVAGGRHRLVAWSYGWDPGWVERVAERLDPRIVFQADFTKGVAVERHGMTVPAGDYTLSAVGPSPVYTRLREAAARVNRPFFAKTEHAISLDAIFVPYLPALDQLRDRAAAVRQTQPDGWFANWEHYGFLVPFPALLLNRFGWDPLPDPEAVLDDLARQRYGPRAVTQVRAAWSAISAGLRAFPYADPIARSPGPLQKGPTQPLWLDPRIPAEGPWRSWQNDLGWTEPWGPAIARTCLAEAAAGYLAGLDAFARAIPLTSGPDRRRLEADLRIIRVLAATMHTAIAQIDWVLERDRLASTRGRDRRVCLERLAAIARDQRARLAEILSDLDADSRLGFAQDGGGVVRGGLFTPAVARRAMGLLDDLLSRQLPDAGHASIVPWRLAG